MHECLLCKRDMKRSKNLFGSGCINNIFEFLEIKRPAKSKEKEKILYKNIMERNSILKLTKNQKIWLTDRYLTREYLNKLNYGNLEDIKEEINRDINRISGIKKFSELKTSRKITLKEAYDLYKKEEKFNTNLEKLKTADWTDEIKLKLLMSGFRYIFNLYRFKNQYEKDAFKEMQYRFWLEVIEGGRLVGFDISAEFLEHSLEGKPKDMYIKDGYIVDKIRENEGFKRKIREIVKNYGNGKNEFNVENEERGVEFTDRDLYFSIHSAEVSVSGKKNDGEWKFSIKLHDTYDYTDFKDLLEYYTDTDNVLKSILSSVLYNLAYFSMEVGVMKKYKIFIEFEVNESEVM